MKVKVYSKVLGSISTNCYFVVNEDNNQLVIIDPAAEAEVIKQFISDKALNPAGILLTHGHFDHILAVDEIKNEYNIPVFAYIGEKETIMNEEYNLSESFGCSISACDINYFGDDSVIGLAGLFFKTITTPGHTQGSVCYYLEDAKVLFSGDTLFHESVGRSDFPGGSHSSLINSIKEKLFILPDDVVVYTGHGQSTEIGYEKIYNPFCQ